MSLPRLAHLHELQVTQIIVDVVPLRFHENLHLELVVLKQALLKLIFELLVVLQDPIEVELARVEALLTLSAVAASFSGILISVGIKARDPEVLEETQILVYIRHLLHDLIEDKVDKLLKGGCLLSRAHLIYHV